MALQFIFGGSGSGKSHYLYKRILKEAQAEPGREYIVLVPEQFTMQTQKDLVLMSERKGIMNIDVLSFVRLAHRIFEETGKGAVPVLDDEGKSLILRKVGADCEGRLRFLGGNIRKLGYIAQVKSALSEFMQYDVGAEQLDQVMEAAGKETAFYYKIQDLRTLYQAFQEYLREKYITKEELLDVLADAVKESAILKDSTVVLDGYTGFTPVQNRLLRELLKTCRDVVVTVTIDDREDPYIYEGPCQLFAMSKQTVRALVAIAREERIEIREPIALGERPFPRFAKSRELEFLERRIFRSGRGAYEGETEAVQIHCAPGPAGEAEAAARAVRALVRQEGYRYREIGVIVSDMGTYGDYLKREFLRLDIPVFMDQKRSVLLNAFVEYIRSLLGMARENFTFQSVFRFLRSGCFDIGEDDLDDLENYCFGLGIQGYSRWQQRWVRRLDGMSEEDLGRLNHLRVEVVERLDGLLFVLRQRSKTVRDITEALYDFLAGQDMQRVLRQKEERFQEEGELALAREYAQIYGIVLELFDKFVELLGDEKVSLDEYCQLLDAGLAEAKVGVIPPGVDQVVAGDLMRTRLKGVKALLFLGANDTFLPGNLMRTGILSERDRARFQQEKIALTPGGKEQAYIQKYYLYLNLTKPSEKLLVFYSKVSSEGKMLRPAYLVSEIRRLFPDIRVVDEEDRGLRGAELSPRTGMRDLIRAMRERDGDAAWMELYKWYRSDEECRDTLDDIVGAMFWEGRKSSLGKTVAERLYGRDQLESITRMEKFSACAYAHFLNYGLRLKERKEYEFQALDMGNVFHSALERYSRKAAASAEGWLGLNQERQRELSDESVEEAVTDYGNSVLYSSARNTWMITRIKHMMQRTVWALTEQLRQGDFMPEGYELNFGRGKIDRVDVCRDGDNVYVKVVDYKTGNVEFDISMLYQGLQMQLMVYMKEASDLAARRHPEAEIIPAGVLYYWIRDLLLDKQKIKGDLREEMLGAMRPTGLVSLEKESLKHLEHQRSGESFAIPVKFKKDGELAAASRVTSGRNFRMLCEYAEKKAEEIHERIRSGEILARPYRQGNRTGCDYCKYRRICGFDPGLSGYEYHQVKKMSMEETLGRMREYLADKGEERS